MLEAARSAAVQLLKTRAARLPFPEFAVEAEEIDAAFSVNLANSDGFVDVLIQLHPDKVEGWTRAFVRAMARAGFSCARLAVNELDAHVRSRKG
jgi:hypothetical protein